MLVHTAARKCLIAIASVAILLSAAPTAHAQVCGDGNLNAGEQCDDGNLVDGDCCTHLCRFVAVGTVCRLSVDPCDVTETCQPGESLCPPDTGIVGDSDGDGFCDALDLCPGAPDPNQVDRDGDGIGDACDPCTNVYPGIIKGAKLRLRKLLFPSGSQRVKYRGTLELPPGTTFDPEANGLRFMLKDGVGLVSVDVTLPPGPYNLALRRGWRSNRDGSLSMYSDHLGTAGGIQKATLRGEQTNANRVRFAIFGQNGNFGLPAAEPVIATVILQPPLAIDGQCAESAFPIGACFFRNQEAKLICH